MTARKPHRRRWETIEKIAVYAICAFISVTLTVSAKLMNDAFVRLNAIELSTAKNAQMIDLVIERFVHDKH